MLAGLILIALVALTPGLPLFALFYLPLAIIRGLIKPYR